MITVTLPSAMEAGMTVTIQSSGCPVTIKQAETQPARSADIISHFSDLVSTLGRSGLMAFFKNNPMTTLEIKKKLLMIFKRGQHRD